MAYKQRILESWTKQRPNLAKWPFFYNLDHPVGPTCPNRAADRPHRADPGGWEFVCEW